MKKIFILLLILMFSISCSNNEKKGTINSTETYESEVIEKEYDDNSYNYQEYSYWYIVYELSGDLYSLNGDRFKSSMLIKCNFNYLPLNDIINYIYEMKEKEFKGVTITNFIRINKDTYDHNDNNIKNLYIEK